MCKYLYITFGIQRRTFKKHAVTTLACELLTAPIYLSLQIKLQPIENCETLSGTGVDYQQVGAHAWRKIG